MLILPMMPLDAGQSKQHVTAVEPQFLTPATTAWLGCMSKQAFRVPDVATEDRTFPVTVSPAGIIRILGPGLVRGGSKIGFFAFQAEQEGTVQVSFENGETTKLSVTPQPIAGDWEQPQIISPAAHAAVWGEVIVRVAMIELPGLSTPPLPMLKLSDGKLLEPDEIIPAAGNSHHQYIYRFPTGKLKQNGCLEMTPVATLPNGTELVGRMLPVRIYKGKPKIIAHGECEDTIDTPRPERQGDKPPKVIQEAGASGDACIANYSSRPSWVFQFEAPENGFYQVAVRARGSRQHVPTPALGLLLGEENNALTTGSLATIHWHQLPVGAPVYYKKGKHTLTVFFENDVNSKVGDSNLYLDSYQVAKVAPPRDATGLRVAFSKPIHGRKISGAVRIDGLCTWQNMQQGIAPQVALLLNGKESEVQYGDNVNFRVEPDQLRNGANTIQLRASLNSGHPVLTSEQQIIRPHMELAVNVTRKRWLATIFDPAWKGGVRKMIEGASKNSPGKFISITSNADLPLDLPKHFHGNFKLSLSAKGQHFEGHPELEVFALKGDQMIPLAKKEIKGNSSAHNFGTIKIPRGSSRLVFRFANDHYIEGKGDRNIQLRSVQLQPVTRKPVPQEVAAKITYPANHDTIGMVDVLVVDGCTANGIRKLELTVDGEPSGILANAVNNFGPFVFPLAGQNLSAGKHQLGIVIQTLDDRKFSIEPVTVQVEKDQQDAGRYARAVHLLNRFGFGPEPVHLAAVLNQGEIPWLKEMIYQQADFPGIAAARNFALTRHRSDGAVPNRSLLSMLLTDNPVHGRFTLWSENHFSTWLRKAGRENKTVEDERFFHLGIAPFRQLLMASATSPAMLVYLDQPKSIAGRLNENYAREIMELHTLGVNGGYSQDDVTALARLLTGWTLVKQVDPALGATRESFRFYRKINNPDDHQVFSASFPAVQPTHQYARVHSAIEMLAAHPATARYVSEKLAAHYVAVPPPQQLVEDLSNVFLASGGDMREMLLAIAEHPEFWQAEPTISTPFDYAIRLGRMVQSTDANSIQNFLQRSGSGHFDRETPDGYPLDGAAYADSNGMLQRWLLGKKFENQYAKILTREYKNHGQLADKLTSARLLDYSMQRLTGSSLSKRSREALLQVLEVAPEKPYDRMRMLGIAIAQLPESNLR